MNDKAKKSAASKSKDTGQAVTDASTAKKRHCLVKGQVGLGLLVLAAVAGGLGWQVFKLQREQVTLQAKVVAMQQSFSDKTQARVHRVDTTLTALSSKQQALSSSVSQLSADSRLLQQVKIRELRNLVQLAEQKWQIEKDALSTQWLLKEVISQAKTLSDNAEVNTAQQALMQGLAVLEKTPLPDLNAVLLQLDAVGMLIPRLPLPATTLQAIRKAKVPQAQAAAPKEAVKHDWRSALKETGERLLSLVKVRELDTNLPVLLPPAARAYLDIHIRLILEQAAFAASVGDEAGYQSKLIKAVAWITRFYDTQQQPTQTALKNLIALRHASIVARIPTLNVALKRARAALEKAGPTKHAAVATQGDVS